jgi:hypothetical protein
MLPDEASSYGILLKKLYTELRVLTGAERIYLVVMLKGTPFSCLVIATDKGDSRTRRRVPAERFYM